MAASTLMLAALSLLASNRQRTFDTISLCLFGAYGLATLAFRTEPLDSSPGAAVVDELADACRIAALMAALMAALVVIWLLQCPAGGGRKTTF